MKSFSMCPTMIHPHKVRSNLHRSVMTEFTSGSDGQTCTVRAWTTSMCPKFSRSSTSCWVLIFLIIQLNPLKSIILQSILIYSLPLIASKSNQSLLLHLQSHFPYRSTASYSSNSALLSHLHNLLIHFYWGHGGCNPCKIDSKLYKVCIFEHFRSVQHVRPITLEANLFDVWIVTRCKHYRWHIIKTKNTNPKMFVKLQRLYL